MLCPHCNTEIPTEGLDPGQWVTCGKCDATVQAPDVEHAAADVAAGDTFFEKRKAAQHQMFRSFRNQSIAVSGLVVTVAALIVGIAAYRAKGRSERTMAIREAGGIVLYDYQFNVSQGRYKFDATPGAWSWLADLFGPDFLYEVTAIDLGTDHELLESDRFGSPDLDDVDTPDFKASANDNTMKTLGEIESLQLLSVAGQPITNDGVRSIKHLSRLIYLDLRDTKITDKAGPSLAAIRTLKFVDLRGTKFTRAAFRELERLLPHTEILRGRAMIVH